MVGSPPEVGRLGHMSRLPLLSTARSSSNTVSHSDGSAERPTSPVAGRFPFACFLLRRKTPLPTKYRFAYNNTPFSDPTRLVPGQTRQTAMALSIAFPVWKKGTSTRCPCRFTGGNHRPSRNYTAVAPPYPTTVQVKPLSMNCGRPRFVPVTVTVQ